MQFNEIGRRERVRAVSFLAAAFVVMGGVVIQQNQMVRSYQRAQAIGYLHAFSELTSSMEQIDASLEKSRYATSPDTIAALCTEIYGEASAAQLALGELPYANIELEQTTSFVSKVGDYMQSLSKSAAAHKGYSEDELENIAALSKASSQLKTALDELEGQIYDGTAVLESAEEVEGRLSELTSQEPVTVGSNYESIETEFPELPTLIYDGPFSEALQNQTPKQLDGAKTVPANTALQRAAQFLGVEESALERAMDVDGSIPCYRFTLTHSDGSVCGIEVTKQGGQVIAMNDSHNASAPKLTAEEAVERGKAFLAAQGMDDMTESYYTQQGNLLTVNYAPQQNGVLCYPDLVKVEIALDSGTITGYDSTGYLTCHQQRGQLTAAVSDRQAQQAVSEQLNVLSHQLALIPLSGGGEQLCWEFKCENDEGKHYIVYANAATGEEEKLLILLEEENGTLVL